MAEQNQQNQQQIQIKITDEVLKGVYSNMMQVSHTPEEFIFDFMSIAGGAGIVVSRVMVSPEHMKRIVAALQDNLKRYEAQFKEIKGGPVNAAPAVASSTGPSFGFDTEKAK
jgi:hypothetical protein